MDDASFALSEPVRVLHQAGVRHLLVLPETAHKSTEDEPDPGWAPILAKLPPAPLVLLTYMDLGADLTGQADPERGALWRRLIKELGLPKGSLGFLPYAFPVAGQPRFFIQSFFSHVTRLRPRFLFIFEDVSPHPITVASADHLRSSSQLFVMKQYPSANELQLLTALQFKALADEMRLLLTP